MDKKSKIFFAVLFLLIVGSVTATYWRIVVKKNYIIEAQLECDPETEECFVWECDPDSIEEGEACTGDSESDVWYYKIIRKKAGNIALCDPETDEDLSAEEAECNPLVCEEGEEDCEIVLCNEENKIEQEVECNDPAQYILDNPIEEEEAEEEAEEELEAEEENASAEEGSEESVTQEETEAEETIDETAELVQ